MIPLASLSLLALPATLAAAPQWPQYRGPDRSGAVPGVPWSPHGQAKPLWQLKVAKGYSGPSIAKGRLVTMGYDETARADRMVCLDAKTGEKHWHRDVPATDKPRYHGGGTLTTPTIAGDHIYWLQRRGALRKLELATGKILWARDYAKELKVEATFHGFAASPIVADGRVYLQLGGLVVAVTPDSGKVLWRSVDHGDVSYSNLAMLNAEGTPALAGILGESVFVLARADGKVLHEYPWPLRGNAVHCATPIPIGRDQLFVSTAYGKGCALLQATAAKKLKKVWSNRRMRNKVTACILHDGHVYGFDESMLRCLDLAGNSKWRKRGLGLGSMSMVGDRMLILNSDGELIIAQATPEEFRELSRQKVLDDGVYWTAPVFADGLIYVRNSLGDLRCLDHRLDASATADRGDAAQPKPPQPQTLFARHHNSVQGAAFRREDRALRITGTWDIPLRGLADGKMTWTMVAPNAWDMRLDEGGLTYNFDGRDAWAIEPQGPRIVGGNELRETAQLFPLPTLFAPSCPKDAVCAPHVVRFAETSCWQVRSKSQQTSHYFDVKTGRLLGTEGTGYSTLTFQGSQTLAGLTLPRRVIRYRAEDGQEHILTLTSARWIPTPKDLFDAPTAIRLLRRTPAQLARDSTRLRRRFGDALGRYQAKDKSTPLRDDIFELTVDKGNLWLVLPDSPYRVLVESSNKGVYGIEGPPVRFSMERSKGGAVTALKVYLPGEKELMIHRLAK